MEILPRLNKQRRFSRYVYVALNGSLPKNSASRMLGFEEKGAYYYHGIFSVLVAAYATSHLAHLFSHVHVATTSHYVYSQSLPSIYLLSIIPLDIFLLLNKWNELLFLRFMSQFVDLLIPDQMQSFNTSR